MKTGTIVFFITMTITAGLIAAGLIALYSPSIKNKAGPNWLWRLGKYDPVRNIFFRQDGSLRHYSRLGLTLVLIPVLLAVLFLWAFTGWSIVTS